MSREIVHFNNGRYRVVVRRNEHVGTLEVRVEFPDGRSTYGGPLPGEPVTYASYLPPKYIRQVVHDIFANRGRKYATAKDYEALIDKNEAYYRYVIGAKDFQFI